LPHRPISHTVYIFREGEVLGRPHLGMRFLADSNTWNMNGKPQNCETAAQEYSTEPAGF